MYNICSKAFETGLKKLLLRTISYDEVSGFLEGKKIHESIGSAQEALHFIKTKHLPVVVFKLDLSKYFHGYDGSY